MKDNKNLRKFLAIILIFTLTSTNFMFVSKSLATTVVEEVLNVKSDTGHKNVGFEAYFETEMDSKDVSVISDVNNDNLAINMDLSVQKAGYLKDAKIEIVEKEQGRGLNFAIKESKDELQEDTQIESDLKGENQIKIEDEENSQIQSIENNTIYLKQINFGTETNIVLPIEYKNKTYVNENDISNDFLVKFSGTYIDDEGEKIDVSNERTLTISWEDERELKVTTEATKYIGYEEGVIFQSLIRVDNTSEKENSLPVKETELNIEVPEFKGVKPSNVAVVANNTTGTNGESSGEVIFNEDNWSYEDGKLTIKINNNKKLVKYDEFEDEFLKDEEKIVEEERYYNKPGTDEFLITYTYQDVIQPSETVILNSNIEVKETIFSGDKNKENIEIITNNNSYEYSLQGQTGSIVSLNIENESQEVSKVYMYSNYRNTEKNETELKSKVILNISNEDIIENLSLQDTENAYLDGNGNIIANQDVYYKELSISKESFLKILGENGEIQILDLEGTEIAKINNSTEVQEDGNIVIKFNEKINQLVYKASKPVNKGNLVINITKAIESSSLDKSTLESIEGISLKMLLKANYTYVEDEVTVEESQTITKLLNTTTKANLVLDRNSLSTLSLNENVELRVALNNAVETSDLYGNSTFEIVLPEYIENIEVTNIGLLYGEGLEIEDYSLEGRVIRVKLRGIQKGINSAILTNGTNIVINANIKVNVFTPLKADIISLRYTNEEATNYNEEGYSEVKVNYSAPTGVVAVNSILNYKADNSLLTSVKQGTKTDLIDVYANSKTAKMELLLMNNNENIISNLSILGRFPFKDVKDIVTGNSLGTTLDVKLLSNIIADEKNATMFDVYYSSNGEATADLNNPENNWLQNPETMENIKSYLLIPQDKEYKMQQSEVLKFTYDFEIPENLPHNESIYGTYIAYYMNNLEKAVIDDISFPDIVGITTGAGPELELNLNLDKEEVREFEKLKMVASVKNIGKDKAENIALEIPIPSNSKYVSADIDKDNAEVKVEENTLKVLAESLEKEENLNVSVILSAKEIEKINSETKEAYIEPKANLEAKDLGTVLTATGNKTKVNEAEFQISEYNTLVVAGDPNKTYEVGDELDFTVQVKNLTSSTLNNVVVTKEIPAEFEIVKSNVEKYKDGAMTEINKGNFDTQSRILTWNLDSLDSRDCAYMNYTVKIIKISDELTKDSIGTISKVKADGTQTYETEALKVNVAKTLLSINQITDTTDTYINEGENIRYTFTVKNESDVELRNVTLKDIAPDGISISKISYSYGDISKEDTNPNKDIATVIVNLVSKEELTVVIDAVALINDGAKEKTATNSATVSADNVDEITSNAITHIVRSVDEAYSLESSNNTQVSTKTGTSNITQTYKITGTVWEDANKNGMREDTENTITNNVQIRLVDSQTGTIKKSVTPDVNGRYSLSGVTNGSYLIIFDYDTVKYGVTTYRKEGVDSKVNSDAIATKLVQDGKTRNGAITDVITISNASVSNIDMGLVLADTFDLELTSSITKVTIQTSKNTSTMNYDHETLVKEEIASKNISGAKVLVEYEIKITNKGDIAGYAKKIVDYLPEGMSFNSSLDANSIWYTGSDGNLYSNVLADTQLASGESKTIKLVLTKDMTESNTGLVNNLTEIYEDYNVYGVSDFNSTPGNKAQGENDLGSADTIILIKTGETFIYISIIITTIILGSIAIFVVYRKIVLPKRKGGV